MNSISCLLSWELIWLCIKIQYQLVISKAQRKENNFFSLRTEDLKQVCSSNVLF